MAKDRSRDTERDIAIVTSVREGMLTLPGYPANDEQREVKSRFWTAFKANPLVDERDVTPALGEELTGQSVAGWVSDKRFWPWFVTRQQTEIWLEAAAERAAALALFYLDPAVPMNDNARVSLIKAVLEFSGRNPPTRREIKWADREIATASAEELDAMAEKLSSQARRKPKDSQGT